MPLPQSQLYGLQWEETRYGLEPHWTVEPKLESLESTMQSLWPSKKIGIEVFAQGAFNKLYEVTVEGQPPLLLRVTLPVDPRYKTLSEVATTRWAYHSGFIPVPRIVAYDCSRDSDVGFEWILMTMLQGTRLADAWGKLDFSRKAALVKKFASISVSLFRREFEGIGNIYPETNAIRTPTTGRIVSMPFFWHNHIHLDIDRGPYFSSREWISARLSLYRSDCISILNKYEDETELDSKAEDEVDDATRTLHIVDKLQSLVNQTFPILRYGEEQTVLCHGDLHMSNILVDKSGRLTGIIDWECVSALPVWKACSYPRFLESKPRNKMPDITVYSNLGLYQKHLMDYELTQLRGVFMEQVDKLEPRWISIFNASQVQRDFDLAVDFCNVKLSSKSILKWADSIAAGKIDVQSLRNMMYGR